MDGPAARTTLSSLAVSLGVMLMLAMSSAWCVTSPGDVEAGRGENVYAQHCAGCHEQSAGNTPPRSALERLSPSRILRALDSGLMMSIAYPLRRDEREAVARYLGRGEPEPPLTRAAFCTRPMPRLDGRARAGWNGWSPGQANARFQAVRAAGITAATVGRLKLRWAFGFRSDITAYAAPSVVNGALFVGSASGTIHALDARTGCVHWTFEAGAGVRAAPLIRAAGGRVLLLVGDQAGVFHALDARNGRLVWQRRIDAHEATRLTGSPAAYGDLVFVPAASWEESRALSDDYPCCSFRGSITALRVGDGSLVWKTYFVDTPARTNPGAEGVARHGPSGAAVWSAPTIDARRHRLYAATGDNYSVPASSMSDAVVALDVDSGRILWSRQTTPNDVWNAGCSHHGPNCPDTGGPDLDYGAAPILVRSAQRDILLAGQKSGVVYALDPGNRGEILWQSRVGRGGGAGGIQWGLAADGHRVYAAVADAVRVQGSSLGMTPLGNGGFDPVQGGGLTALEIPSGTTAWRAPSHPCEPPRAGCSPAQPGAITAIPGVVFSGSMDGHLRAFATRDGAVLWDVDTARDYQTVDAVTARGGSLDGAGPVIVDGMLYVNSGYPRFGGTPGNVLLAFSIDGS